MVGAFVNDAKSEIEDMWMWGDLRYTDDKTVPSGSNTFDLSDLEFDSKVVMIWNNTLDRQVTQMSAAQWRRLKYAGDDDTGDVTKYAYDGATSTDSRIRVYPTPTQSNSLTLELYKPQDELTEDATVCMVPPRAVYLTALYNLAEERGEMNSTTMNKMHNTAKDAVRAAIARDVERYPLEIDWVGV